MGLVVGGKLVGKVLRENRSLILGKSGAIAEGVGEKGDGRGNLVLHGGLLKLNDPCGAAMAWALGLFQGALGDGIQGAR